MSSRGLYAIAILAYLLFLGGLAVSIVLLEDETARLMAMSFLSTGLVTFTVLFAVFLSKGDASERYKELYMSEDANGKKE